MARILVVDDDRSIRRSLEKFLGGLGYDVETAADGDAALAAPAAEVVLLDLGLPGRSGFDVLTALAQTAQPPQVIVVTARDDMQSTVRAIQLGAYEYLVKPVDIDRLRLVVARALETRLARAALDARVAGEAESYQVGNILGHAPAIREIWKQIGAVSTTRAPVLIVGESGTGKELVARAIHTASADRDRPFVAVNCTALSPGVLESELFGHVKGAFTGAERDRAGRFELAAQGTLFLDEIGEIPLELQAKLLRVLQERTFERVGDARPRPLDARVVAATHRDLPALVAAGRFREDLYYRLRVVELALPPLRDRPSDIPVLIEGLLVKINRELHRAIRGVTPAALAMLCRYPWPGNVRELENLLTRAVVLSKGEVLDEDLLPLTATPPPTVSGSRTPEPDTLISLREVERRHIARVLTHTEWNKRRACAILEISRPTLDRKIEEYALVREGA